MENALTDPGEVPVNLGTSVYRFTATMKKTMPASITKESLLIAGKTDPLVGFGWFRFLNPVESVRFRVGSCWLWSWLIAIIIITIRWLGNSFRSSKRFPIEQGIHREHGYPKRSVYRSLLTTTTIWKIHYKWRFSWENHL